MLADVDKLCKTTTRNRFTCGKTATGLAESVNHSFKNGRKNVLKTLNVFELMNTLTAWEDERKLKTLRALIKEVVRGDFKNKPWSAYVNDAWIRHMEKSAQETERVEYDDASGLFKVKRNHLGGNCRRLQLTVGGYS